MLTDGSCHSRGAFLQVHQLEDGWARSYQSGTRKEHDATEELCELHDGKIF